VTAVFGKSAATRGRSDAFLLDPSGVANTWLAGRESVWLIVVVPLLTEAVTVPNRLRSNSWIPLMLMGSDIQSLSRLQMNLSFCYYSGMDTRDILASLDSEITRLTEARNLLAGLSAPKRRGRPKGAPVASAAPIETVKRRTMSAAGRKRIAEAQRKRWAKQKAA
jgi:hypothetical protein